MSTKIRPEKIIALHEARDVFLSKVLNTSITTLSCAAGDLDIDKADALDGIRVLQQHLDSSPENFAAHWKDRWLTQYHAVCAGTPMTR